MPKNKWIKNYVPCCFSVTLITLSCLYSNYMEFLSDCLEHKPRLPIPIYEVHNTVITIWPIESNNRLKFKFIAISLKKISRFFG